MTALRPFGLEVKATEGSYHALVDRGIQPRRPIVLTERGDTVTENALLAAARHDGVTIIRNASPNYMVQDLCFFLTELGVHDRRHRHHHAARARRRADRPRRRLRAERGPDRGDEPAHRRHRDRLEITMRRAPIEFLEIELALLEEMGFGYDRSRGVPGR